jgi:hypothetical protein
MSIFLTTGFIIAISIVYVIIGVIVFCARAWNSDFFVAIFTGIFWLPVAIGYVLYFICKPIITLAMQRG